ncbi:hypothetical protein ACHAWU_000590 [Discostella pseudostelligera]|uniref:Uncharacterized protein n=1 Tax=Discostella pseudostelligera TaxID=259834 RepID=A0ABD3MCR3_9STRA
MMHHHHSLSMMERVLLLALVPASVLGQDTAEPSPAPTDIITDEPTPKPSLDPTVGVEAAVTPEPTPAVTAEPTDATGTPATATDDAETLSPSSAGKLVSPSGKPSSLDWDALPGKWWTTAPSGSPGPPDGWLSPTKSPTKVSELFIQILQNFRFVIRPRVLKISCHPTFHSIPGGGLPGQLSLRCVIYEEANQKAKNQEADEEANEEADPRPHAGTYLLPHFQSNSLSVSGLRAVFEPV